jgi:hypothetical protein
LCCFDIALCHQGSVGLPDQSTLGRMTSNSKMTYLADSSRSSNVEALPYAAPRPMTPDTMPMTILSKCPRCCDFIDQVATRTSQMMVHSADVAAKAPFAPISITGGMLADEAMALFAK